MIKNKSDELKIARKKYQLTEISSDFVMIPFSLGLPLTVSFLRTLNKLVRNVDSS